MYNDKKIQRSEVGSDKMLADFCGRKLATGRSLSLLIILGVKAIVAK